MSRHARILVAELIGTMILILGGPGTVIFGQFLGFNIGVLAVALAFGLSLLCAAYLFGHISGCHINPAVTLGMWALKRTDGKEVPAYLVGQILGAAIGAFIIWAILETGDNGGGRKLAREALFGGASNGFADHSPSHFAFWAVVITEVVFTAHLASVLKTMALDGRGIAWLPASLIADELESGRLVQAGGDDWKIDVEIRLFRSSAALPRAAEAFWRAASCLDEGPTRVGDPVRAAQ